MARSSTRLLGILALGLIPILGAQAADHVRLEPSAKSNWMLDYGADRCRLARYFGEGDQRTLLYMEQYAPGDTLLLTVAGPAVRQLSRAAKIVIRFGPVQTEAVSQNFSIADFKELGPAIILGYVMPGKQPQRQSKGEDPNLVSGLPQIDIATAGKVEWLSLQGNGALVTFALPQMHDAMAVLNNCSQDLVRYWGLDVERHKTMTRRAELLNYAQVAPKIEQAYPGSAGSRVEQANLLVHLLVTVDGKVSDCSIAEETTSETLGMQSNACQAFQKLGRFAPALDSAGKPMASFYSVEIHYRTD